MSKVGIDIKGFVNTKNREIKTPINNEVENFVK